MTSTGSTSSASSGTATNSASAIPTVSNDFLSKIGSIFSFGTEDPNAIKAALFGTGATTSNTGGTDFLPGFFGGLPGIKPTGDLSLYSFDSDVNKQDAVNKINSIDVTLLKTPQDIAAFNQLKDNINNAVVKPVDNTANTTTPPVTATTTTPPVTETTTKPPVTQTTSAQAVASSTNTQTGDNNAASNAGASNAPNTAASINSILANSSITSQEQAQQIADWASSHSLTASDIALSMGLPIGTVNTYFSNHNISLAPGFNGASNASVSTSGAIATSGTTSSSSVPGTTGTTGISGATGTGVTNVTGVTGTTGTTGTTGITGTGITNAPGTTGTTGTGITNAPGTTGTTGITSSTGTTSTTGTTSVTGTTGTTSTTGGTGTTGTTGKTGTTGITGTTGGTGTTGTTGGTGTTGKTGTSGTTGTTGGTGTTGETGTTGTTGATGKTGTTGTTGTTGATGTSGTTGTSGISGTTGSSGTSGTSGTGTKVPTTSGTTPATGAALSGSTTNTYGTLPANLVASMLAAAPVSERKKLMDDLKQLYPGLNHLDSHTLSLLSGKSAQNDNAGSGALMKLGMSMLGPQTGSSGAPLAPTQVASTTSTPIPGTGLGTGVSNPSGFNALTSAGLQAINGGALPTYKDGGTVDHNPEFITGATGHYVKGKGDGQSDDIPAMLADGEYVFDADTVAALGNGSSDAGAEMLDKMRQAIRKHKRSAPPDKIPPKAKSPLEYLKGVK
jgi:hypothetical protein